MMLLQPFFHGLIQVSYPNPSTIHSFALVPKVANPELVSEFHPISICNVLYKIYSKVLANRLKKFLPSLITEHQSAFTKERLISDNIMVAFETLHHMKQHNSGKHGFMAIKLDMSKAYDRVEWVYLERLMEKMGYCARWVAFMMSYVKMASYSIMVNGEPIGMIYPKRGIRRGDPYLLSFSFYAWKDFMLSLNTRRGMGISRAFPCANEALS